MRLDLLAREVVERVAGAEAPRVAIEAEPVVVLGDEERLRQLIGNLVQNALRHASAHRARCRCGCGDARRVCAGGGRRRPGRPDPMRSRRSSTFLSRRPRPRRGRRAGPAWAWRSCATSRASTVGGRGPPIGLPTAARSSASSCPPSRPGPTMPKSRRRRSAGPPGRNVSVTSGAGHFGRAWNPASRPRGPGDGHGPLARSRAGQPANLPAEHARASRGPPPAPRASTAQAS